MDGLAPRVLVAAPAAVAELRTVLHEYAALAEARTMDEAVLSLHVEPPDLLLVEYSFDEGRPFRLIKYARDQPGLADLVIVLICALPRWPDVAPDAEVREICTALRIDEFVNLHDEIQRSGREAALSRFQSALLTLFPIPFSAPDRREKAG